MTDENYKNMKRAKDFYGEIKEIFRFKQWYSVDSSRIYMQHVSAETTELPEGDMQNCAD